MLLKDVSIILRVNVKNRRKGDDTPSQLESAALLLAVGLSPNKNAIINAPASKLAERYYHIFTRLVA